MSASDMSAFADARIAALKAGLTLNAEQEKLWPPVESALRDNAKKRVARFENFRAEREKQAGPVDPIARMRRGAEFMTERGAELKRLADAAQPLYDKLDEAQKNRLGILMRAGMRGHGMQRHGMGGHRFGDAGDGRGSHMGARDHDSGQEHGMGGHGMGGRGMGGYGMDGRGPGDRGGERL
jgi:hypothetical protein